MPEQNLKLVRAAHDPFRRNKIQAAQIGLTGTDRGDEGKYRRLSSKSEQDLSPMKYEDVCKKAFYLWQRNIVAKRVLEILTDFCTGEDLKVKVKIKKRIKDKSDEDTQRKEGQQIWDDFWEDPINDLENDFPELVIDRLMNGELALPANVNPTNGKVLLGYYSSWYIKDVIGVEGNSRKIDKIKLQLPDVTEPITKKVIRYNVDENPETNKDYGKLTGEVFFFQTNRLLSQMRGYSMIMELIDWLDAYDQFMFGVIDGFDARNDYFYDCKMDGLTQSEIESKKVERPQRGAVNLHNEKAEWKVINPELGANEASEAAKMFRLHIVGSKGFPITWFGEGDTTNKATAEAMTVPTLRMLKRIQKTIKNMLKFIAQFVLQQANDKNNILAADEYFDIEVSIFDISSKDLSQSTAGMTQLIQALATAANAGWVTNENAKKVVDGFINSLGIEVDPNETPKMVKNKNEQEGGEEAYKEKPAPVLEEEG